LNPFSQQASGRRPTPHTARLFGSVNYQLTENQNIKLVSLSALFEYSICLGCCAFSSIAKLPMFRKECNYSTRY
jgi:hypothetical protein